ncbi:MAG TPA: adenylate kinase [Verrucomicrobiae bacterium]|jgi:adenylate kinase|nr:adenylate kinase [Verrucomicrobiae bacterium]
MRVIFLGPPGAGKGTHAKMLAGNFHLAHLAAGDCLRRHIRGETKLGAKAKDIIAKGELVPDALVNEMMEEEIWRSRSMFRGFILDGYPRTIKQGEALDKYCKKEKFSINGAINFKATDGVIVERLGGRLACVQCGANFHLKNIQPKKDGVCDKCGGELKQRADDKPETVKHRLEVYHKESEPLIEYYKSKNMLTEVDGDLALNPLQEILTKIFESYKAK